MVDKLRPDNVRDRVTAGKLDRKIVILRATVTQDPGSGEEIENWNLPGSHFATVWASWRRASARETLAASEVSAEVTDVFHCAWSPKMADVNAKDRISYAGRVYNISEAAEIGRREGIMLRGAARAE